MLPEPGLSGRHPARRHHQTQDHDHQHGNQPLPLAPPLNPQPPKQTTWKANQPPPSNTQFAPEADVWHHNLPTANTSTIAALGPLTAINITLPGVSPLHPTIHCTAAPSTLCHATTGEGEINAAASLTALTLSPRFDLRQTYFLVGGIAGVNPRRATLGGVALARFAVQVALQHEFDAREELPEGWETGYVAFGEREPYGVPGIWYGTEVMELNAGLRDRAAWYAGRAVLRDSEDAAAYRKRYDVGAGEDGVRAFAAGVAGPKVVKCDAATSDVYYSGRLLSEAFEKVTEVWTNGTGSYCMTAQEDNATLEVLVRMAVAGLVDFGRVIVMRTGKSSRKRSEEVSRYSSLTLNRVQLRPPAPGRHPLRPPPGASPEWLRHRHREHLPGRNRDCKGHFGGLGRRSRERYPGSQLHRGRLRQPRRPARLWPG